MRPDFQRVGDIIVEIAAREMLPRYRNLDASAVKAKESPTDLVTTVDHAVEDALRVAFARIAPAATFIGEEAAAADPSIADAISTAPQCWIVDPLDGTRNFVNHVDEFGTIVAYVENGETIAGWIYAAPDLALITAVKGEGVSRNGERIQTAPQADARPSGLRSTGWLADEWREPIVTNLKSNVASRSGHCSAYAYLKLLEGNIDFKLSSRIHAWDHAAGALMAEELGGAVRWIDTGGRYRPEQSADRPLLAVAPGRDWELIANLIRN